MSDIVEKLRASVAYEPEFDYHGNACNVNEENTLYQDAATEIERLRSIVDYWKKQAAALTISKEQSD